MFLISLSSLVKKKKLTEAIKLKYIQNQPTEELQKWFLEQ